MQYAILEKKAEQAAAATIRKVFSKRPFIGNISYAMRDAIDPSKLDFSKFKKAAMQQQYPGMFARLFYAAPPEAVKEFFLLVEAADSFHEVMTSLNSKLQVLSGMQTRIR